MLNEMTNQQLIETLKAASDSEENIALKMLLIIAMERITQLDQRVRDDSVGKSIPTGWDNERTN